MDKFTIPPGYTGKCTPDALRIMADRLANIGGLADALRFAETRRSQRNVILDAAQRVKADSLRTKLPNLGDREQLRRHFLLRWSLPNPVGAGDQCEEDRTLMFAADPPRWEEANERLAPSFKELIETKLGPCEPDPMQELHDKVLSEITTTLCDRQARKLGKIRALVGGLMTSAASNTVSKPFNLADVERFSTYMDEVASAPTRDWFLLDTPLIRGEFGLLDGVRFINASPSHQPIKKETPVNTKPLTITTKTFTYINGLNVDNFTSAELYDMIAREEAQIRALEAIDHKPVMLKQEITRRKDGIAALVAHLDGFDVVPTPAPVVTDTDVSNALATGL